MIEITAGVTSISAGTDSLEVLEQDFASPSGAACAPRRPTGARVTVEFQRDSSLSAGQPVTVHYDFADDGHLRQLTGIPRPIRTVVRRGRAVMFCYRLSQWIAASAVMEFSRDERPLAATHRLHALRAVREVVSRRSSG